MPVSGHTWQHLLDEALPAIDYTVNMVTAGLDLTKAKEALGYEPAVPFEAGVERTLRWYREQGWLKQG